MRRAKAAEVRAAIAEAILDDAQPVAVLGEITLLKHQRDAVDRLRNLLERHGGAVLADEAGLGKTYVALTLMAAASRPVVVAPATLRHTWHEAMRRSGVKAPLLSYEQLSRGPPPPTECDLLVLDEAHHVRNRATRRYRRAARLGRGARTLMLTATPIHNSPNDLRSLIALYFGSRALHMSADALRSHVVRRERHDLDTDSPLPVLHTPEWIRANDDTAVLDAIMSLPPPLPASDAGDGGVLLKLNLVRLWASSRAALERSLRLRLSRAMALQSSLAAGRHPDRRALAAWCADETSVQMTFAQLLDGNVLTPERAGELRNVVDAHAGRLRALLARLGRERSADELRATQLADICSRHPNERIVAFTQYAETARMLFRALRWRAGICALTASAARIAGGPISRTQALQAFAPSAHGVPPPRAIESIRLLIATDLLSEGINLHDASVVVHLDLPWTVARLEQRVGRVRRLGSKHRQVTVYAFAPPAPAAVLLGAERRLRDKMAAAGRTVGVEHRLLPPELAAEFTEAPLAADERLRRRLDRWRRHTPAAPLPAVAAVAARMDGCLAAISNGDDAWLVALVDGRISVQPRDLDALSAAAEGEDAPVLLAPLRCTVRTLHRWLSWRRAAAAAGLDEAPPALGRQAARRIASEIAAAPLHRRSELAALAVEARASLDRPIGLLEEEEIEALLRSRRGAEWLLEVARRGRGRRNFERGSSDPSHAENVVAMLLLTS